MFLYKGGKFPHVATQFQCFARHQERAEGLHHVVSQKVVKVVGVFPGVVFVFLVVVSHDGLRSNPGPSYKTFFPVADTIHPEWLELWRCNRQFV